MDQLTNYDDFTLKQLIDERRELSHELAAVKFAIEQSSAAYHEDDIQGNRYEYAENQHDKRALESDIQYLTELIEQRKWDRMQGDIKDEFSLEPEDLEVE